MHGPGGVPNPTQNIRINFSLCRNIPFLTLIQEGTGKWDNRPVALPKSQPKMALQPNCEAAISSIGEAAEGIGVRR